MVCAPKLSATKNTHMSARTTGPIFSLNLMGQPVVVVNDFQTAADLVGTSSSWSLPFGNSLSISGLDRRSAIYSGRPWFVMSCEILTGGLFFGLLPYGKQYASL